MNPINKDEVITEIRKIARKQKISHLDASILYCEVNEIEIEAFASFVKSARGKDLQKFLFRDGKKLNLIKKNERL